MEVCEKYITLPESSGNLHSHDGDDAIHIHPQFPKETGAGANLGRFFDSFPMIMESNRIQTPGNHLYENGDTCMDEDGYIYADGRSSTVQVLVNKEDMTETFRSYTPRDGEFVEVYFK